MSVYYMNQGIKLYSNNRVGGYSSTGSDAIRGTRGSRSLVSELETFLGFI